MPAQRESEKSSKAALGRWVLWASILGSSMAFIDGSAVNVILPALQTSLKASTSQVQWVVEAYTLFLGALLLTGGSLGDLFGQRTIFGFGVLLFTVGSVYCGLAPDTLQLILARAIQGVGGALLVPTSLALLSVTFDHKEVGKAIGIWSGATAITSSVGPLLGGWLAQHASWRWVFFINVPFAVVVGAIVLWRMPAATSKKSRVPVDWLGSILATLGLGGIVFGFLESNVWVGVGGAILMAGFVVAERREKSPMLPLNIFKSSDFTGTAILTLMLYGALSGALFFLPLNLVQVQGYSETAAGAALLPFVILMATLSRWSAQLLERFEARWLLFVGPMLVAIGLGLFCIPSIGGSYWVAFFPGAVVLGFGMAVTVAPLTTTVMNSVDKGREGIASGVNNALSRVAGLITIAVFGLLMTFVYRHQMSGSLASLSPGLAVEKAQGPEKEAVKLAFVSGFRWVMAVSAGLTVLGALASLVLIGRGAEKGKAENG